MAATPSLGRWNEQIGRAVWRHTKRAGFSNNSLWEKTRELGRPVHRVAIAKISTGHRDLTVQELVGLAAALQVPPLALLFPDVREAVELFPGNPVDGVDALGWFTGAGDHPQQDSSAIQLASALVANEVALKNQRHNLFQHERGLELEEAGSISMVPGMREHEQENVEHARRQIKFLESRRKELLSTYSRLIDGEFDA